MNDESLVERIKRRALFRRAELAPNRYVRFEKNVERQLQRLSDQASVEGAELVRILIDEALERRGLQPIEAAARATAPGGRGPKANAGLSAGRRLGAQAAEVELMPA